jgi:hypothetical protein
MSYNIERRSEQYVQARKKVEKMYPGAKLKANENAGYFVENAEGRNIIALKYPDMAFADNVMSAYINLDIVSHWNKIEDRNSRKFRNDVKNVCVVGDVVSTTRPLMEQTVHVADWATSDGQPEE